MSTRQYSNYADLITFSRASGGTALRPVSYGDELVTNGTFDTDSDWTITPSGSSEISNGVLFADDAASTATQSNLGTEDNKMYVVEFDYTYQGTATAGVRAYVRLGQVSGQKSVSGAYPSQTKRAYLIMQAGSGNYLQLVPVLNSGETFTIDNVSVKEVLFDQPTAPITLFNHPANIPRIEYDADGNRLGLLIEEQRTNLVTYSEEFDNAVWLKSGATITADAAVSPDGVSNAEFLVESATASAKYIYNRVSGFTTGAIGTTYQYSVYAKAGVGVRYLQLYPKSVPSGSALGRYDLQNVSYLVSGTNATASIQDVGNGWRRCTLTWVAATSGQTTDHYIGLADDLSDPVQTSYTGDGTSGIYIWGAQLEEGSFPTSYIPTSGSTATRAADNASIPVADFGYNQKAGSVVVEWDTLDTSFHLINFNTDSNNRWALYGSGGSSVNAYTQDNGVPVMNSTLGLIIDGTNKTSMSISSESGNGSQNGAAVVSDTSVSVPIIERLTIGNAESGSIYLNGHIKSINYYPRRLTNAQLQELTS